MLQIKVMIFPTLSDGFSQFNKNGINMQIAVESNGKHKIFQNQDAFVNLNLKTSIHNIRNTNSKTPTAKKNILFDIINSL